MSFILDALRKSDAERQRTATPGITDVRYSPRRQRRNVWMPVLVVVLLANMTVMAMYWFGERPAQSPQAAPVMPAEEQPPAFVPPTPGVRAPAGVRSLAREAEPADSQRSRASDDIPEAPVIAEMTEQRRRSMTDEPTTVTPAAAPPPATGPVTTSLPTADQLIAQGTLVVPELNLDLHVYSGNPADRFVMINSRRYNEGTELREGPAVESITPDGVILASQGTRFILPRK